MKDVCPCCTLNWLVDGELYCWACKMCGYSCEYLDWDYEEEWEEEDWEED